MMQCRHATLYRRSLPNRRLRSKLYLAVESPSILQGCPQFYRKARRQLMFAVRLVQLIETHADKLSEALIHKLENADECREFLDKVPAHELKHRTYEIYRHLGDWLLSKTLSEVEERYIGLGARRARQGVPFSQVMFAIQTTKQVLWDYLLLEGLLEPEDLIGEMQLVRSLGQFFDRTLYYAAIGYEQVWKNELAAASSSHVATHR